MYAPAANEFASEVYVASHWKTVVLVPNDFVVPYLSIVSSNNLYDQTAPILATTPAALASDELAIVLKHHHL